MTSTLTSDFRSEYETQRHMFLRRRVLWFTGLVAAFFAVLLLWQTIWAALDPSEIGRLFWIKLVVRSTNLALYGAAFLYGMSRKSLLTRRRMVWIITGLILATAFLLYVPAQVVTAIFNDAFMSESNTSIGSLPVWLTQVALLHIVASLCIPWTPKESVVPIIPVLAVNAVLLLFKDDGAVMVVLAIMLSNVVYLPGMGIAWWRQSRFHSRFHYSMLRGRYMQMKRELTDAQRIHEALFPKPIVDGAVHFDYLYEPMRQIGGDFLFTHRRQGEGSDALSVVIIDVTGHGIPAALTVNRLHGELQRLFGENPLLNPGDALDAINRYVLLTMAEHSVFATALCLRVNPDEGTLEYANGGHPPAFIRTIDGRIDQLDSTTFMPGVVHDEIFAPGQRSVRFEPGDALVAYTDGANEVINAAGRMLTIDGIRRAVASDCKEVHESLGKVVLEAVDTHRAGPIQDDTLIVEIRRPIAQTSPRQSDTLSAV